MKLFWTDKPSSLRNSSSFLILILEALDIGGKLISIWKFAFSVADISPWDLRPSWGSGSTRWTGFGCTEDDVISIGFGITGRLVCW